MNWVYLMLARQGPIVPSWTLEIPGVTCATKKQNITVLTYLETRVASKFWCSSSETVFYWIALIFLACVVFGINGIVLSFHMFCRLEAFRYPEKCGSVAKEVELPLMDFAVKVPPPLCTMMRITDGQVKPSTQNNLFVCHFINQIFSKQFNQKKKWRV